MSGVKRGGVILPLYFIDYIPILLVKYPDLLEIIFETRHVRSGFIRLGFSYNSNFLLKWSNILLLTEVTVLILVGHYGPYLLDLLVFLSLVPLYNKLWPS